MIAGPELVTPSKHFLSHKVMMSKTNTRLSQGEDSRLSLYLI